MKGQQNLFVEAQKDALAELLEIARIQSTEASNRIEGIITTDDRLKKIVMNKTTPKGRSEREIAGYRDVLNTIHENYDFIPVRPGMILQLHRDLYKFSNSAIGGSFKNSDNVIAESLPDGTRRVRFQPVPAWETSEAMDTLCNAFRDALTDEELDPLLLTPMFILDFLCIHPFNDGNGRMSRLLTLLLLYRSGYFVGKYVSIERLIADSKETYYEVLQDSSTGWHEGSNDYLPFVRYMLGIVIAAYREFASRVDVLITRGLSKPGRVREIIRSTTGQITKTQIMKQCPDISQKTVERALKELIDSGEIMKIGGGRYTSYTWNWEKE
jgi:Fic family protein